MTNKLVGHLTYRTKKQGMSNLIIIIGKKGSGKSYLSLRIGEVTQGKTFGMNHVCFNLQELFKVLDEGEYEPNDVLILEEIGVAANARDAMSRMNKHLSFVAQAIRPARINLIVNTISWGLIDAQVRNMADYRIEVVGHDVVSELTEFKFLKISPRQDNPEPYKEHLAFNDKDGRPVKFISWTMRKPSDKLAAEYEAKRMEYLKQIYSDGAATSSGDDDIRFGIGKKKGATPRITIAEYADKVLGFRESFEIDGKISSALVSEKFGVGRNTSAAIVALVKYKWQQIGGAHTH